MTAAPSGSEVVARVRAQVEAFKKENGHPPAYVVVSEEEALALIRQLSMYFDDTRVVVLGANAVATRAPAGVARA